jgi:predicted DCC family thiol-disulfide oxidoreductase YuxK
MTKITCFHDGECPICNVEIDTMKKIDKAHNVNWVDISKDKIALKNAGLTYKQAMEKMYVIDENNQIQSGIQGFLCVWEQIPYYRKLASVIKIIPFSLTILNLFYGIFAYYRLPLTGKKRIQKEDE